MDARIQKILKILDREYPNPKPSLHFSTPFELLVATILSAQCTDARVNIVTKNLFKAANTPEKIVKLGTAKLEKHIRSTGFYKAKTRSLLEMSRMLLGKFDGRVPDTLEKLTSLRGVGRKTASVVLSQAFDVPAFPVDRHVLRVTNRLGLAHHDNDPTKTDMEVRKKIPAKYWIRLHLQIIAHGRTICRPKPKCEICPLLRVCPEGIRRKKLNLL